MTPTTHAPHIALVDDDTHSARLLIRTLLTQDIPEIKWLGGAETGYERLHEVLGDPDAAWPSLVIIDLKSHSSANLEFVAAIGPLLNQKRVPLAVMAQPLNGNSEAALKAAGAAAVFFRQAERDAYRHEAARIANFWMQHQRLETVGT